MTESETINRKDITAEITDLDIDFDKIADEEPVKSDKSEQPEELNAFVGVLDMLIDSSGDMLKEYGYPAPNLTVWEKWGKENLSKALNAYMPESMGCEISSPAMAGMIGFGALVLTFLPVIMKVIADQKDVEKDTGRISEPEKPTPPDEKKEYVDTYEEPQQVKPTSTAPISEHMRTVFERMEAGATIPGL
jgi:hypothetical protein